MSYQDVLNSGKGVHCGCALRVIYKTFLFRRSSVTWSMWSSLRWGQCSTKEVSWIGGAPVLGIFIVFCMSSSMVLYSSAIGANQKLQYSTSPMAKHHVYLLRMIEVEFSTPVQHLASPQASHPLPQAIYITRMLLPR